LSSPQSSPHRLPPSPHLPPAAPRRATPGCTPALAPAGGSWRRLRWHSHPPFNPLAPMPPSPRPTALARIPRPPKPSSVCYHRRAAPFPTAPTRIPLPRHPRLPRLPNTKHMPLCRPALCFVKSISDSSLPLFFFILICIFGSSKCRPAAGLLRIGLLTATPYSHHCRVFRSRSN
jgi:hypothetical protein